MRNIKAILLIVIFILASCQNGQNKNHEQTSIHSSDDFFRKSTEFGCSYRIPNNTEYCGCFADVMLEVTPIELRNKIGNIPTNQFTQEMSELVRKNLDIIRSCDHLYVEDLEVRDKPNSKELDEILRQHNLNLLSPADVKNIDLAELKLGYEFSSQNIVPNRNGELDKARNYRLTKISGEDYIFSILDQSGSVLYPDSVMWKNGIMYIRPANSSEFKSFEFGHECKFVIGICEYKAPGGKTERINTKFENGVWIRNISGGSKRRKLSKEVYDKNGLPLYELDEGGWISMEKIRIK